MQASVDSIMLVVAVILDFRRRAAGQPKPSSSFGKQELLSAVSIFSIGLNMLSLFCFVSFLIVLFFFVDIA